MVALMSATTVNFWACVLIPATTCRCSTTPWDLSHEACPFRRQHSFQEYGGEGSYPDGFLLSEVFWLRQRDVLDLDRVLTDHSLRPARKCDSTWK